MDCVLRWKRLTLNYVFKRKVPNLINTMDTAKLFKISVSFYEDYDCPLWSLLTSIICV